jgi:hypothetical protein
MKGVVKWVTRHWGLLVAAVLIWVMATFGEGSWRYLGALLLGALARFAENFIEEKSLLRYVRRVSEAGFLVGGAAGGAGQHSTKNAREAALSVTFLNQVREQIDRACMLLFIAAVGILEPVCKL